MNSIISKETVQTVCCYCGVGCGVTATVENNQITAIKGDAQHPANAGKLCVKGSFLHETQKTDDRLLHPQLHGDNVTWDEALDYVATKMKAIVEQYGPNSVGFYLSGQLLTEDYYVANKLMKGFIGSANVDTNSRLCMASASAAHKRAFGGDVVPGCYDDLEETDVIILVGSNLAYAHPIVYQRIVKAKQLRPELQIVVLDPRRTATCEIADIHLPLFAGSDAFFFNGLLSFLSQNNALDNDFISQHCDGFEEALTAAQSDVFDVDTVARYCDLSREAIEQVYNLFIQSSKVVTVFSQGINQSSSGVDKANAIINCHLATGKIGKEGATPFSITGQPNAMGGREVGGLANQLAAHMYFDDSEDVERVQRFWHAPNMARKEGLKAVDMFKAVDSGDIKAIWIMATNPVVSMPNADFIKAALEKCELVVVSECIANTDTALTADVLLPATTWSEKHGMVTNSERYISLQKGFLTAPGEAMHDWEIITRVAQKMGFADAFNYQNSVEIFREHAELSGLDNDNARGFDISAFSHISEQDYNNFKPIQWPVNAANPLGSKRFFSDGGFFTANKKAKFVAIHAQLPLSKPNQNHVVMNTGRIRDQWHTMSRTGIASKLWGHTQEPFIDIHPTDIARFGLVEGGLAILRNLNSSFYGRVISQPGQRPGDIFVPIHWNQKYASSSRVDALVNDITDPNSGQPEFKHCTVSVSPFPVAWQGFILSQESRTPSTSYWTKLAIDKGSKCRIADEDGSRNWSVWLAEMYPNVDEWVQLFDSDKHFYRACGFDKNRLSVALFVEWGHQPVKESRWLEQQLGDEFTPLQRQALLAGKPPGKSIETGAVICSCYQVGQIAIQQAIAEGCVSASELGAKLKCGTNCGSCIPELNALINVSAVSASTVNSST